MGVLDVVNFCDRTCTRVRGKILLAWEYDSPMEEQPTLFGGPKFLPKPPQVDNDVVRFNGWKDEGHETFLVTREKHDSSLGKEESFDFCKTAGKPYDLAVMLCLLVMSEAAPRSFRAESDGEWDHEWVPAREAFEKIFGRKPKCPFSKKSESAR